MAHLYESGLQIGKAAWHGLGVTLDAESPVRFNIDEAIRVSELDWDVRLQPSFTLIDGQWQSIPGRFAVVRSGNRVLGSVGSRTCLLQNREAFNWFQPWLETKEVAIETCGSLREGRTVWVMAKILREPLSVFGDLVEKYLLLSNTHDGTQAIRVGYTPVRVVCNNTLTTAISNEQSQLIRVRHTSGVKVSLAAIRETIDLVDRQFVASAEQYKRLAACDVSLDDVVKYVRKVFELPEEGEVSTRQQNRLDKVVELARSGMGQDGSLTAWSAFNGVTEYLTHHAVKDQAKRMNSLWFGHNKDQLVRSLDLAIQLAS